MTASYIGLYVWPDLDEYEKMFCLTELQAYVRERERSTMEPHFEYPLRRKKQSFRDLV
jgi:hypothetical protein